MTASACNCSKKSRARLSGEPISLDGTATVSFRLCVKRAFYEQFRRGIPRPTLAHKIALPLSVEIGMA